VAHETSRTRRGRRVLANRRRLTALALGGALALFGVGGLFTPGDELLAFGATPLLDVVHLVTGLFGVAVGLFGATYADEYNQTMAVGYAALVLVWLTYPDEALALLNAGVADAWLHGALAAVFGAVGFFAPLAGYRRS
jgi:hypothetical protein